MRPRDKIRVPEPPLISLKASLVFCCLVSLIPPTMRNHNSHFHLPRVQSISNLFDQVRDAMKQYKHEKESEAHLVRISRLVAEAVVKSTANFTIIESAVQQRACASVVVCAQVTPQTYQQMCRLSQDIYINIDPRTILRT